MTTPLIRECIRVLCSGDLDPVEMTWFDLSSTDMHTPINTQYIIDCRPPFEKCMVLHRCSNHHANGSHDFMMFTAGNDPYEGIVISAWGGPTGVMPKKLPMMIYKIIDGQIKYGPVNDEPIAKDDVDDYLGVLSGWYGSLLSKCDAYRPTIAKTFTNRRKIAAGKKPSYDWHTVVIKPQPPKSVSLGGTHASPRLHDRRGHLRKLPSGKSVWVRQCKVGNAALGSVFHDYEVRT